MNKKEVAQYLGRSTRLVEQYAAAGKLGEVNYVRGKSGEQAQYEQKAVVKLKAELGPAHSTAVSSPEGADVEDIRGLLSEMLDEPRSTSVRVSEKLLLDLNDCRLLTGLSISMLRNAVKAGTLKATIIGRAYKVKRQDLNEFVTNL